MSTTTTTAESQHTESGTTDDKQSPGLSHEILHSLSSEEYFQYFGIGSYLKDSLSLCLELQPKNELEFFADYFTRVQQGTTPLIRALRFVTIAPPTSDVYMENLASAYKTLGGPDKLNGTTFSALIQQLFPKSRPEFSSVSKVLVTQWMKRQDTISAPITFIEFVAGIVQAQSFIDVFDEVIADLQASHSIKNGMITVSAANNVIHRLTGFTHNFLQSDGNKTLSAPSPLPSSTASSKPAELQLTLEDVCAGLFLELMKAANNIKPTTSGE